MNTFEIEIKVLLGKESKAKEVIDKIHQKDTNTKLTDQNNQLNHYFLIDGDLNKAKELIKKYLHAEHHNKLDDVIVKGKKHSMRTRDVDGKVLFVIKASIDDTTSSNGTARIEFEEEIPGLSIHQLDQILLDNGFSFQSKWSRQRKEYKYKDFNVCIDKNAGYGYVAEFEKIIYDSSLADQTKDEIRKELAELWIEELDQGRLERMFTHYNSNRPEYYGTEKTFIIE